MDKIKRKRALFYLLVFVFFLVLFVQYQYRAPRRNFSDFHVPYTIGKKILNAEEIYSFDKGLSYFKYPPFYATLMVPLSQLPENQAANIWLLFNMFFLVVLFHCSKRIIIPDTENYSPLLLYLLSGLVNFRFILWNFHEGQANIFMLTLLTLGLFFYLDNQRFKSGFFIGFSVMTKYMSLAFLPYFLTIGEFPFFLWPFIYISLFNFLPLLVFGWARTVELIFGQFNFLFASALDTYSVTCFPNQSLLSCIARFFWKESGYPIKIAQLGGNWIVGGFLVSAALLYFLAVYPVSGKAFQKHPRRSRMEHSLNWALIFICMALFNPNGWGNFFICLVFPNMLLIYYTLKTKFKDRLVTFLYFISIALNSLTSKEIVNSWAGDQFEIYSCITFGSLSLFLAILVLKFKLRRQVLSDNLQS